MTLCKQLPINVMLNSYGFWKYPTWYILFKHCQMAYMCDTVIIGHLIAIIGHLIAIIGYLITIIGHLIDRELQSEGSGAVHYRKYFG